MQTAAGNGVSVSYTYDVNGNRAQATYANGLKEEYHYNLANILTELYNKNGSSAILSSYQYGYRLDGNQVRKAEQSGKVTTYAYDGLSRLVNETVTGNGNNQSMTYAYNPSGNRDTLIAAGDESFVTSYQYGENNRLLTEIKTAGDTTETTSYTYDTNGNQIGKRTEVLESASGNPSLNLDGGGWELRSYNNLNQLTGVTAKDMEAAYAYLPNGIRAAKTVNGTTTAFTWVHYL